MSARILLLWTAAVLASALAFIVHLTLRFETVRLGYDVSEARAEQRKLVESRRLLSLEAATLSQSDRVEAVARGSFDMDVPAPTRVISVGGKSRVLSGRSR
jgi:cell division protein FtsL